MIAVATLCVYGFGTQYLFWKVTDKLIGIRVPAASEIAGLDETEVAPFGYPDFSVKKALDIPLPAEYAIVGASDTKK